MKHNLLFFIAIFLLSHTGFSADKIKSKKGDLPSVLGGIVRSDKWIIERNPPMEKFIGNVSYKNPFYEIKTDWALFKRKKGLFYAKGSTYGKKIWQDKSISEIFCDEAEYDYHKKIAKAYSKKNKFVEIIHTEPQIGKWQSKSQKALFDENLQRVDLISDVLVTGEQNNAASDKISYYYQRDGFEFLGSPVIWGTYDTYDFAATGEKAKTDNFFDKIEIKEKVKGWIKIKNQELANETEMQKP